MEEAEEEEEEEGAFFVCQKALLLAKMKLQNNMEIERQVLEAMSYPGDFPDEEVLVPVDLSAVEEKLSGNGDSVPLVDEEGRLAIGHLIQRLGMREAAAAILEAQQRFLENPNAEPEDSRPKPISAREWREAWDEWPEEGEEEELLEGEEEEEEVEEEAEGAEAGEEEEVGDVGGQSGPQQQDDDGDGPSAKRAR